ncbi:MAG: hypothetical protein ACTSUE_11430 [Promethearchaeota archaeon]
MDSSGMNADINCNKEDSKEMPNKIIKKTNIFCLVFRLFFKKITKKMKTRKNATSGPNERKKSPGLSIWNIFFHHVYLGVNR